MSWFKEHKTALIVLILLVLGGALFWGHRAAASCNVAYIKLHGALVTYISPAEATSTHWGCGSSNDAFGAVEPSRSGDNFSENGYAGTPVDTIFVTESQWDSINNNAPSTQD